MLKSKKICIYMTKSRILKNVKNKKFEELNCYSCKKKNLLKELQKKEFIKMIKPPKIYLQTENIRTCVSNNPIDLKSHFSY